MHQLEHYSHHGSDVLVRTDLKGKHRDFCLCYLCLKFKPGQVDNCPVAQALYLNCVKYNVVTPVWECPVMFPDPAMTTLVPSST